MSGFEEQLPELFRFKTGDWLELLASSGCVSEKKMKALFDEPRQLIAIFTSMEKNSKG